MAKALVLADIKDGKVKKATLEVVHALNSQGCEVDVLGFGPGAQSGSADIAKDIGAQGAKKLFVAGSDAYKFYNAEAFEAATLETFKAGAYDILAGAASSWVKDL